MTTKLFTGLIVAFWLVMMTLLVRYEFFPNQNDLIPVSPQTVLKRVFTADEASNLRVYYEGKEAGSARLQIEPVTRDQNESVAPASEETIEKSRYRMTVNLHIRMRIMETLSKFRLALVMLFDQQYHPTWFNAKLNNADSALSIKRDMSSPTLTLELKQGQSEQTHTIDLSQLGSQKDVSQLNQLGLDANALFGISPDSTAPIVRAAIPPITTTHSTLRVSGETVPTFLVTASYSEMLWFKIWIGMQGQVLKVDSSLGISMVVEGLTVEETNSLPRARL